MVCLCWRAGWGVLGWAVLLGPVWGGAGLFTIDPRPVAEVEPHRLTSYADILEKARAAVVLVRAESIVPRPEDSTGDELLRHFRGLSNGEGNVPGQEDPDLEKKLLQELLLPPERRIPHGIGSGVFISPDGYLLTSNHVIATEQGDPADSVVLVRGNGEVLDARIIGRDPRSDIALLKVSSGAGGESFPFLPLADSDQLRVGDVVFAVGNPLGLGQASTMGIISATGRSNLGLLGAGAYENFIQTDAAINRGNSGGALVDAAGRLVGINTAIFSRTGGNMGIGFAVPSLMARDVAAEILHYGEVRRGFLGVSIRDLNNRMGAGSSIAKGVRIERADPGLPASEAGLRPGDIIIGVDDYEIEDVNTLRFRIAAYRPGTSVRVRYLRDGAEAVVSTVLTSLDGPGHPSQADE